MVLYPGEAVKLSLYTIAACGDFYLDWYCHVFNLLQSVLIMPMSQLLSV